MSLHNRTRLNPCCRGLSYSCFTGFFMKTDMFTPDWRNSRRWPDVAQQHQNNIRSKFSVCREGCISIRRIQKCYLSFPISTSLTFVHTLDLANRSSDDLQLGKRLKRWPNCQPPLFWCLVFPGNLWEATHDNVVIPKWRCLCPAHDHLHLSCSHIPIGDTWSDFGNR